MKKILSLVALTQLSLTGCAAVLPLSVATTAVVMSDERSVGTIIDDRVVATKVINEIVVELKNMKDSANDTMIESSIGSKLLLEKNLHSTSYKISVNDGIVFLLGIAQNQDEMNKVLSIASSTKGVNKVVNYIILKTDPRRS